MTTATATYGPAAALAELSRGPLAIERRYLDGVITALESGQPMAAYTLRQASAPQSREATAVLPLEGFISYNRTPLTDILGGTALSEWVPKFRSLVRSPSVSAIVLAVDSPGGEITGVREAAREIYAARSRKRIITQATCACSAAYWLTAASSRFYVLGSGLVGSIGVIMRHVDRSEANTKAGLKVTIVENDSSPYKAELWPDRRLTPAAGGHLRQMVNRLAGQFEADLARYRATTVETVRQDFGRGRVFDGHEGVECGLVDEVVDDLESLLLRLASTRRGSDLRRRAMVMAGVDEKRMDRLSQAARNKARAESLVRRRELRGMAESSGLPFATTREERAADEVKRARELRRSELDYLETQLKH